MKQYPKQGFTLIELLIAMVLGMIVVMVAGKGFHDASIASANAMNGMQMHQEVRQFFRIFEEDVANMVTTSAIDFQGTAGQLVFLTQVQNLDLDYDGTQKNNLNSPLMWVKYEYDSDPNVLKIFRTVYRSAGTGNPTPNRTTVYTFGAPDGEATVFGTILKNVSLFTLSGRDQNGASLTDGTTPGRSPRGSSATWPARLKLEITLENENMTPMDGQTKYSKTFTHEVRVPGSK